MSNNQARWALSGGIGRGTGFFLWSFAICLLGVAGLAQADIARVALNAAEQAAARDVAYLAVVVMFAAMGFAWWQSRENNRLAHEATVAAVETAQAIQRMADMLQGVERPVQVDGYVEDLLKRRTKR